MIAKAIRIQTHCVLLSFSTKVFFDSNSHICVILPSIHLAEDTLQTSITRVLMRCVKLSLNNVTDCVLGFMKNLGGIFFFGECNITNFTTMFISNGWLEIVLSF